MKTFRICGRLGVLALTTALVMGVAAPASAASELQTSSAETYQTNGRVTAMVTVGNVTYLGGSFTSLRPPGAVAGTGEVPRARLAAVDNVTGELLDWNPGANKTVLTLAASADGATIYVGGVFSNVGGATRKRVAAVSATTGAVTSFRVDTDLAVEALAVTAERLYLGGAFTVAGGVPRARLAAVDLAGQVDATWVPAADGRVRAVVVDPSTAEVWIGGHFTSVNGDSAQSKLAKLSAATGAPLTLKSRPGWPVWDVVVASSGVFAGGDGPGGNTAAYGTDGAFKWSHRTDGGVQAIALLGDELYIGGHFDNACPDKACSTMVNRRKILAVDAATGVLDAWNPGANSNLGVFALTGAAEGLVAGGDFTKIGGRAQQGFGQFR